ncbi:MAG: 4Fe-4S binding protein [Candidatus Thorarchaeota archaeon]
MASEIVKKNKGGLARKISFPAHEVKNPTVHNLIDAVKDSKFLRYRQDIPRFELTKIPLFDWLFHQRWWQFITAFPNVLIFNLVMVAGFIGVTDPNTNFATIITWYLWFTLVFFIMIGVGRGWCLICPFSAQSEWLQRLTLWGKSDKSFSLNKKWPSKYSTVIIPTLFFLFLTYLEEYFNIAGPGLPFFTATLVLGILIWDVFYALVFERRTFCRYGCPLTGIIGVTSAVAPFEGYRTKDPSICKSCKTKECMRGSEYSYGCPWYEYPGSMNTNFYCGLCTECVKGCPYDNIGLSVRLPVADSWAPKVKRFDIALSATLLLGLVWFQMINALPFYGDATTGLNGFLNKITGFGYFSSHYMMLSTMGDVYIPNPIDFVGIVILAPLFILLISFIGKRLANNNYDTRKIFTSYSYAVIPLFAGSILARMIPKFVSGVLLVIWSISSPFGFNGWNLLGTNNLNVANTLTNVNNGIDPLWTWIIQVAIVVIAGILSVYAAIRVYKHDFGSDHGSKRILTLMIVTFILLTLLTAIVYYYMAFSNGMVAPF